jgi:hypothetical protein
MDKAQTFRRLKDLGNEACEQLQALGSPARERFGAVNWAHLGVVEVLRCEDEAGAETWLVGIEEASPECGLASYVYDFILDEMPGLALEVRTEW